MLTGYRTYLSILIAIAPAILDAIANGISGGASVITIVGGVLAIVFRYLATQPAA